MSRPANNTRSARVAVISLVSATAAGIALGFVTQILQGSLSESWSVLANSGVMWVLAAFGVGMTMPSQRIAAFGGAATLVAASISYYVAVDVLEGVSSGPTGAVIWSVAGIIAGSAFGAAGYMARRSEHHRPAAWGLVAGVLAGEGIHLIWFVGNDALKPAGITELVLAGLIAFACLYRTRSIRLSASVTTAAAVLTLLGVRIIDGVFAVS